MTDPKETPSSDANAGGNGGDGRTFTQAEVDAILKERLGRVKGQFADYDELKQKAAAYAEYEEKQKTELQKASERATKAEQERDNALKTAQARIIKATFIAEASALGVKRPQDAYALAAADGLEFSIDGENVTGVKEAVKALVDDGRLPLTTRPAAPDLNGGAGSGARPGDKPAALTPEQKETARRMGLTEEQYAAGIKKKQGA